MSILAISYQMGSGGGHIAQMVAERMAYGVVGSKEFGDAVVRYGLTADRATRLGEAKPPLLERLSAETRLYLAVIQVAFYDFAEQDDVVILGRGGQWLLRGIPHALRVRVIAPFEARVKRVSLALAHDGQAVNPDTVRNLISRDDVDKRGRARYLFDSELDNPTLHDLVLNMERFEHDDAAAILEQALRLAELETSLAGRAKVADRALASRVRAALAAADEARHYRVDVDATTGIVSLTASSGLEGAAKIARQVPGVRGVKTKLIEIPPIAPLII